jgi:hypothetical protein
MPVMFDLVPEAQQRGNVLEAVVQAATEIGLFAVVRSRDLASCTASPVLVPMLGRAGADTPELERAPMVVVPEQLYSPTLQRALKEKNPSQVVVVRVASSAGMAARVQQLASRDAEAIQITFDAHGREQVPTRPRHMRDVIREVHGALTQDGTRDKITLISCGGIALAEHITKAVLCGVDMVAIDIPLLLAMECRLCGECSRHGECAVALEQTEVEYGKQRIVNLMGAWHSQLIEMMGAMGIREARRLRGETGRCMFFEDLEKNTFGRLFGRRKANNGASNGASA